MQSDATASCGNVSNIRPHGQVQQTSIRKSQDTSNMANSHLTLKDSVLLFSSIVWTFILFIPHILSALFYLIFPRPRKNIKNEIVLVTGSGAGLGRELAFAFARQGCQVVCVDLKAPENLRTASEIRAMGGNARAYVCNVADREAVLKLAKDVGRVDILVNNAGIYPARDLWNATEEELRTIIDVNLFSQFWTIQGFLPGMKERNHGHVICISSIAVFLGISFAVAYTASKHAVVGLMDSLAHELQTEKKNVKLTTVYPYFLTTRPEISECITTRMPIPMFSSQYAASVILQGVLEDLDSFMIPRWFGVLPMLVGLLPGGCKRIMFDHVGLKCTPPKHDPFKEEMDIGTLRKTGTIEKQKLC